MSQSFVRQLQSGLVFNLQCKGRLMLAEQTSKQLKLESYIIEVRGHYKRIYCMIYRRYRKLTPQQLKTDEQGLGLMRKGLNFEHLFWLISFSGWKLVWKISGNFYSGQANKQSSVIYILRSSKAVMVQLCSGAELLQFVWVYNILQFVWMYNILQFVWVYNIFNTEIYYLSLKTKYQIKNRIAHVNAMKAYVGVEAQRHSFLTLVLCSRKWSGSCPDPLYFRGRRDMHSGFWLENLRERNDQEDPGLDGIVIAEWMLKVVEWVRVDWIHVAQDWDK